MNKILGLLFVGALLTFVPQLQAQRKQKVQNQSIRDATKKCEGAVAKNCVDSGTCADFCRAAYKSSKKLTQNCLAECTGEKRCKAKGPGKQSQITGNRELDTWTTDQLAQCIAEERDPENTKTGRRTIHWRDIITPSLAKLLNKPTNLNRGQDGAIKNAVVTCEKAVAENCVRNGTCTDFCNAAYRTKNPRNKCRTECTADKRCKAKGPGEASTIAGNRELDTWTSDQLAQCIAEERDPENKKTGRRTIHWRDILTPSLAKLLGKPEKINRK